MSFSSLSFVLFQMTSRNLVESNWTLIFDEEITLHLQSKWAFLKHLLRAIRIDSFGIGIEEAQLKMLLVKTVAHSCHGKTRKPRQDQKVMAKPRSQGKTKSHDKAKTTAAQNSHSKMKNSRQNKIATANQKSHGKIKKSTVN